MTLRFGTLAAALAVVMASCVSSGGDDTTAAGTSRGSETSSAPPSTTATGPSDSNTAVASGDEQACMRLDELPGGDVAAAPATDEPFPWDREDPPVREGFDADRIVSGGPPPDGILPIDSPCFDAVATADSWLEPQSPVMVVEVDGDRRAYPLAIMTQHEIVNDVIGGQPVVVTYCPLCNSGLAFFRTLDGTVYDFGTSGRLYQANLVMYDRQTRTLWSQFLGQAVVGDLVSAELERLSTALLNWEEFREASPDGLVLSRDSVPGRTYGRNPYPGYEDAGGQFFDGPQDDTLPANTRVVGLGDESDAVAVAWPDLQDQRVVRVEVGGDPVTVWWAPGQASALDAPTVAGGEDVGSTAAFVPRSDDGTALTFRVDPDDDARFVDDQTGSTWNLLGEAVDGELAGTTLQPVARDDTWWFVWFAFRPDTRVHDPN